jgi:hypothetical protein
VTRRTEITIETSRRLLVRRAGGGSKTWCAKCVAEVNMISANEAAALLHVSTRSIYRWIENGQLHFSEEPDGLLVCADSLLSYNRELNMKVIG